MTNLPEPVSPNTLLTIDEIIRLAKERGYNFRFGDPYNRLRYYIKIGLLPNMVRKVAGNVEGSTGMSDTGKKGGEWEVGPSRPTAPLCELVKAKTLKKNELPITVGHLPAWSVARLLRIQELKNTGLDNDEVRDRIENEAREQRTDEQINRDEELRSVPSSVPPFLQPPFSNTRSSVLRSHTRVASLVFALLIVTAGLAAGAMALPLAANLGRGLSATTAAVIRQTNPRLADRLGLPEDLEKPALTIDEKQLAAILINTQYRGTVLAARTMVPVLEINTDTTLNGSLTVNGAASVSGLFEISGSQLSFLGTGAQQITTAGKTDLALMPGGFVGIGLKTPVYKVDVAGDVNLAGGQVYRIGGVPVLSETKLGDNVTISALTQVGILNAGSISTGFGKIDTGDDNIITTGIMGSAGNTKFTGATLTLTGLFTTGGLITSASSDAKALNFTSDGAGITFGTNGLITTNGNLALMTSGNTGIGTMSPTAKLMVVGSAAGVPVLQLQGASGQTANLFQILNFAGTQQFVVDKNGNVGIGSSAPTDKLDVWGGVKIGSGYAGIGTSAPPNGVLIEGSVGIGTTNPGAYKLYVNGDAFFNGSISSFAGDLLPAVDNASNIGSALLRWQDLWLSRNAYINGNLGVGTTAPGSKAGIAGNLAVGAAYSLLSAPVNGVIVEGNVGIGTTNPGAYALNVTGDVYVTGTLTALGSVIFSGGINPPSDNAYDLGTADLRWRDLWLSRDAYVNGNVGIGTTSPSGKLEVAGNLVISNSGTLTVGEIAYTWPGTQSANALLQTNGSGTLSWSSATGAGIQGYWNRIGTTLLPTTNTDNVTTLGNAGIGNTTPLNKLDVSGSVAIGSLPSSPLPASNGNMLYVSGNVGIGTTNPLFKLDVNGTANIAGALTTTGNITPNADNQYDLGATNLRWKTLHVGTGSVVVHNDATNTNKVTMGFTGNIASLFTDAAAALWLTTGTNQGLFLSSNGNVGVGTTSPTAPGQLNVLGQCVTGDTLLRRRRRRKKGSSLRGDEAGEDPSLVLGTGSAISAGLPRSLGSLAMTEEEWPEATRSLDEGWEDTRIDEIKEGDEIQTLDEATGQLVTAKVKALMDMGRKEIYTLTTVTGKTIRTTANHPYLVAPKITPPRVAVFVDAANLEMSAKLLHLTFDYRDIMKAFPGSLRYYSVDFATTKQRKFMGYLSSLGAKIVTKPLKVITQRHGDDKHKANFDVEIASDAILEKDNYDTLVLFSGDSDFTYTANKLKNLGKKVVVVAPWRTTGRELRSAADLYLDLYRMPFVVKNNEIDNEKRPLRASQSRFINGKDILTQISPLVKPGQWTKVSALLEGQMIVTVGAGGQAIYEQIVSIKQTPAEQVYDIEVEGTHNFVGNGIIAHNTYLQGSGTGAGFTLRTADNNGVDKMVVTDSGNVGIGTTNPTQKLDVFGNLAVTNGGTTTFNGLAYTWPGTQTANALLQTNGSGTLAWSSATGAGIQGYWNRIGTTLLPTTNTDNVTTLGNVGIGNTTPAYNLDVTGTLRSTGSSWLGSGLTGQGLFVKSDGNVGIGNTNPGTNLDVTGTARATTSVASPIFKGNSGAVTFGDVAQATTITGSGLTVVPTTWTATPTISGLITATSGLTANGTVTVAAGFSQTGANTFSTGTGAVSLNGDTTIASGKNLTLTSGNLTLSSGLLSQTGAGNNFFAGNVGIGATNPSYALNVSGNTYITGTLGVGSTASFSSLVNISGLNASQAVYTDASKNLTSAIPTTGSLGFWQRNGTTVAPATIADYVGIGTTSALNPLSVSGSVAFGVLPGAALPQANSAYFSGNIGIGTTNPLTYSINASGDINIASTKAYYINGTSVLNGSTLGVGVTASSLTSTGILVGGSIASGFGTIATANTITGTTLNGTTGINTGAGAGTLRLDSLGALSSITSLSLSGAISGGTTYSGSGNITSTAGLISISGAGNNYLAGNLGIGTTSPVSMLSVGASSQFQVNSTGAITAATGITSSGTINFSGLSASSAVYTDGSKNLTNTVPTSGQLGYWTRSGTNLYNTNQGDNVGIGTTGPTVALDVAGAGKFGTGLTVTAGGETITAGGLTVTAGNISTGQVVDPSINLNLYSNQGLTGVAQYGMYIHPNWSVAATTSGTGILVSSSTGASTGAIYGIHVQNASTFGAGSIANNFGLYIDNITGGATTNYSIYSAGGTNYFGGNVGIGTTGPLSKLDVQGDIFLTSANKLWSRTSDTVGYNAGLTLFDGSGNTYLTNNYAAGNIYFQTTPTTNGSPVTQVTIKPSGNVGIGTTSPAAKFDVVGTSWLRGGSATTGLFVDANGNIGIGTTGPSVKLHVVTGAGTVPGTLNTEGFIVQNNAASAAIARMAILGKNNGQSILDFGDDDAIDVGRIVYSHSNNEMLFVVNGAAGGSEQMVIKSSGNVGIGTTGPSYKLDVSGSSRFTAGGGGVAINLTSGEAIRSSTAVSTTYLDLGIAYFRNGAGAPGTDARVGVGGGLSVGSTYYTTAAPTDGAIIQGNVGIGTTAPSELLHVYGTGNVRGYLQSTNANSVAIFYLQNPSQSYSVGTRGDISQIFAIRDESRAAVRLVIDTGGNVGIGTVSPGAKLSVKGAGLFGSTDAWVQSNVSAGTDLAIQGNVGIGTTNPLQKLHVYRSTDGPPVRFEDSNGYCEIDPTSTSWTCTSDIRLKKDISPISSPDALQSLLDLQGVDFRWNREGPTAQTHFGFVAQAVEKVLPEMVRTDPTSGLKSVAYGAFTPIIVEGIKQQQSEIASLKIASKMASSYITDTMLPAEFSRTREILTTETREIINAKLSENGQILGQQGAKLNTVDKALKALQKQVADLQAVILASGARPGSSASDSGVAALPRMTGGAGNTGLQSILVTASGTIPSDLDYGMGSEASSSAVIGELGNQVISESSPSSSLILESSPSAVLGEATSSATPEASPSSSVIASEASPSAGEARQSEIASSSATPRNDELSATASAEATPSSVPLSSGLQSDVSLATFGSLTVNAGLRVFGQTLLGPTNIAGITTVGNIVIDESSLDAFGILRIQSLARGLIELMAGRITLTTAGDVVLHTGNLVIESGVIAGNDTMRGAVTIPTGGTYAVVTQSWPTAPKSIVVTPDYETKAWVENLGANGFIVRVDTAPDRAQKVYWIAVW